MEWWICFDVLVNHPSTNESVFVMREYVLFIISTRGEYENWIEMEQKMEWECAGFLRGLSMFNCWEGMPANILNWKDFQLYRAYLLRPIFVFIDELEPILIVHFYRSIFHLQRLKCGDLNNEWKEWVRVEARGQAWLPSKTVND